MRWLLQESSNAVETLEHKVDDGEIFDVADDLHRAELSQVSTSILNTGSKRVVLVMATRRWAGICSVSRPGVLWPRGVSVTDAWCGGVRREDAVVEDEIWK